jgi:hypothetical protein
MAGIPQGCNVIFGRLCLRCAAEVSETCAAGGYDEAMHADRLHDQPSVLFELLVFAALALAIAGILISR